MYIVQCNNVVCKCKIKVILQEKNTFLTFDILENINITFVLLINNLYNIIINVDLHIYFLYVSIYLRKFVTECSLIINNNTF